MQESIFYFATIFLLLTIGNGNAGNIADLKLLKNEVLPHINRLENLENEYRLTKQELIKSHTENMKKVYDMLDRNFESLKTNAGGMPYAKLLDKKLRGEFGALESEAKINFQNCYESKLMREFDSITTKTHQLIDASIEILQVMPKECLGLSPTELADCMSKRKIQMLQVKKNAVELGKKLSTVLSQIKIQIPNCYEDVYSKLRQQVKSLRNEVKSYSKNIM